MNKTYELSYTAERIDEMLKEVDEHTIYSDATTEEHGLMSATDKSKLDALPTAQEIDGALNAKVDKEVGKGLSENDYTDEDKAKVATALQVETDPTVPSWAKQSTKPSYDYSEIGNTPDLSGFITKSVNDLTNYYLKSETYTKAEVAALIGAIQQFHYEIYATLPQTGQSNVLYLIGPTGSGSDKYEEYVYSNNAWNKIGDTSIDLSGYVTTSALNTALADYTTKSNLTALLSNKTDKVSNATDGNFAGLDANGNLKDSGYRANDFATSSQGAKAETAYQKPQTGIPESDLDSSVQTSLDKADTVVEVDEVTAAVLCYLNARINGIVEALNNGLPSLKVEELTIARKLVAYITEGNALASGEGAPTILPQYNGQEYFDATNKAWYKAAYTGTSPTAAAWKQITNA